MIFLTYENVIDKYEETHIEHINVPTKYYSKKDEDTECSYQNFTRMFSLSNLEFFTITVLVGKLFSEGRKKLEDYGGQFIKFKDSTDSKDEITILKSLAVNEVKNIYILKDYAAMREIWQEYSYAGFEKLWEWYSDEDIDFQTKISEELLNIFTFNKIDEN